MKKQFTTFLMSAAMMVVAAAFTACSSDVENPVKSNDGIEIPEGKSLFTSGETAGMPVINADADGEAKAMLLNGDDTRTSMAGKAVHQKFAFYWEPGDKIWVKNSNYKQSAPTSITSTQPSAQFMLDGIYSAPRYEVYYVGQNSPQAASSTANALQVTIADQQVQDGWNNSKHLGTSGDCGSCYANLQGNGSYTFSMDHKASYLIFYPYLHTALVSNGDSYTLQKIEVYSDLSNTNIAGTYSFDFQYGLLNSDGSPKTPQAGTAKQAITLTCGDAFGLTTAVPDVTTSTVFNHCFMVIAPGTHSLTVRYVVKNSAGVEYEFVKDISLKQYAENSVYTYIHELRYPEIESELEFNEVNTFYRWGRTTEAYGTSDEGDTSIGPGRSASEGFWAMFPTSGGVVGYRSYIYYDNSFKWKYNRRNGTQEDCRGGWWLLKKEFHDSYGNSFFIQGRPEATELAERWHFFPAFWGVGKTGYYWTKTCDPTNLYARVLELNPTKQEVPAHLKLHSYVAGYRPVTGNIDGSSNTNWFQ